MEVERPHASRWQWKRIEEAWYANHEALSQRFFGIGDLEDTARLRKLWGYKKGGGTPDGEWFTPRQGEEPPGKGDQTTPGVWNTSAWGDQLEQGSLTWAPSGEDDWTPKPDGTTARMAVPAGKGGPPPRPNPRRASNRVGGANDFFASRPE